MKPLLVESLNLPMQGMHSRIRIASRIVLGLELSHLRKKMCYEAGSHWDFREEIESGARLPWIKLCNKYGGITDITARFYEKDGEEVKMRMKESELPGSRELLALMERVPSELTNEERQGMIYEIVRLGIKENETKTDLRRAYRNRFTMADSCQPEINTGDDEEPLLEEDMESASEKIQDNDQLLAANLESLALGAGVNPAMAKMVYLIMRAKKISHIMSKSPFASSGDE